MAEPRRIILPITPQTGLKSVPNASYLMIIPETCPHACGLPRRRNDAEDVVVAKMQKTHPDLYEILGGENYKPRKRRKTIKYGCPHCLSHEGLRAKKRLLRLRKYMEDVAFLAKQQDLILPDSGWSMYFYIPCPTAWPQAKRAKYHGQRHKKKPDIDNLTKPLMDSIVNDDERIAQLSGLGKFWVNTPLYVDKETRKKTCGPGWIEIILDQPEYNPYGVVWINDAEEKNKPKRKWVRNPHVREIKPLKIREDILK